MRTQVVSATRDSRFRAKAAVVVLISAPMGNR
jgi:hypothetical protein